MFRIRIGIATAFRNQLAWKQKLVESLHESHFKSSSKLSTTTHERRFFPLNQHWTHPKLQHASAIVRKPRRPISSIAAPKNAMAQPMDETFGTRGSVEALQMDDERFLGRKWRGMISTMHAILGKLAYMHMWLTWSENWKSVQEFAWSSSWSKLVFLDFWRWRNWF